METMAFQLDGANIPFGRVKNGCKTFPPLLCMLRTAAMNRHEHSSQRVLVAGVQRKSFTQSQGMHHPTLRRCPHDALGTRRRLIGAGLSSR